MKAAKPPAGDAITPASSRRSQPVRQTRTNPPRNSASLNRNATGRNSTNAGHQPGQPIEIFPGITHFTDAITALPKDLVRHFTLLKEVDAKICQPEDQLFQLVHDVLAAPLPNHRSTEATISSSPSSSSTVASSSSSSAPVLVLPGVPRAQAGTPVAGQTNNTANRKQRRSDPTFAADNVPRRMIARQAIQKMQDMLVSLEEKNHVISVANDTLQRQLNRVEEIWPHLEKEFSDEAKWGSTTHWAYPENRLNNRSSQQQSHNGRRDQTGHATATAQALAEEVASRSDARKQAVAAKKRNAPHQESDLDDHHDKHKNDHGRKSHHKSRKAAAESPANVELGISAPGGTPNGNPHPKRRKVDKSSNGIPAAAAGAMATVFGKDAQKAKTASPRETPAPEPTRKRKPLPTSSSNGGKKKNGVAAAALSPSVTSSPVLNNFPEPKAPVRVSPAPTSAPKIASARAKQGSVPANTEESRPSPAAPNKTNGTVPKSPFIGPDPANAKAKENGGRTNPPNDAPLILEPKEEVSEPDSEQPQASIPPAVTRRVPPPPPAEEVAPDPKAVPAAITASTGTTITKTSHGKKEGLSKPEPMSSLQSTVLTTVTTKSGRASKPSTPALSTFPESAPAAPKTRPSRSSESASGKRSHKKGAVARSVLTEEDATSSLQGEDEDTNMDEDEPTYCYCNGVSYGEMVACDADGCEREWFHLECVGLKVAPKTNAKWYCEDCKEKMKNSGKKVNGR